MRNPLASLFKSTFARRDRMLTNPPSLGQKLLSQLLDPIGRPVDEIAQAVCVRRVVANMVAIQ